MSGPEKGLFNYFILSLQTSKWDSSFSVRVKSEFLIWFISFQNCRLVLAKFFRFCLVLALQVWTASVTNLFIFLKLMEVISDYKEADMTRLRQLFAPFQLEDFSRAHSELSPIWSKPPRELCKNALHNTKRDLEFIQRGFLTSKQFKIVFRSFRSTLKKFDFSTFGHICHPVIGRFFQMFRFDT